MNFIGFSDDIEWLTFAVQSKFAVSSLHLGIPLTLLWMFSKLNPGAHTVIEARSSVPGYIFRSFCKHWRFSKFIGVF
jgi:hypothetical protein